MNQDKTNGPTLNLGVKLSNFRLLMTSSDALTRRAGDTYGYAGTDSPNFLRSEDLSEIYIQKIE